jgi:hypothetical protein
MPNGGQIAFEDKVWGTEPLAFLVGSYRVDGDDPMAAPGFAQYVPLLGGFSGPTSASVVNGRALSSFRTKASMRWDQRMGDVWVSFILVSLLPSTCLVLPSNNTYERGERRGGEGRKEERKGRREGGRKKRWKEGGRKGQKRKIPLVGCSGHKALTLQCLFSLLFPF